jgi:hypothetical protein
VPDIAVAGGPGSPEYEREAELPHHLEAEGPAPKTAGPPLEPAAGHSYLDFQLSMAVDFLRRTMAVSRTSPQHA